MSPGTSLTGIPGLCTDSGTIRSTAESAVAQAELTSAYDTISAQPCLTISALLDGQTLAPGVYCVPPATSNLTGTLTLNGSGVYMFRFSSTLITSSTGGVNLIGGASCGNVHWQVGSSATLAGSFAGNVMAFSSITVNPGTTLTGRALARNAAVTMTTATVSNASCN